MIGLGHSIAGGSRVRSLAERDTDAYERLLISKGGGLGDGAISRDEARGRLLEFVTWLYIIYGRQDFIALQPAFQVGLGSKIFTFHGKEGALVNGPSWVDSGIDLSGNVAYNEYINLPKGLLGTGSPDFTVFTVIVTDVGGKEMWAYINGDGPNNSATIYSGSIDDSLWAAVTWGGALSVGSLTIGKRYWRGVAYQDSNQEVRNFASESAYGTRTAFAPFSIDGTEEAGSGRGAIVHDGIISFYAFIKNACSTREQSEQLYAVYKRTIGKGVIF